MGDSTSPLSTYQAKRDFGETPEPAGAVEPSGGALRFVVQEHHATALHWDLRLERGGVLVSWALPKGVPPDPRTNHLAVHTEDHPMQYLDFQGSIPAGNYGAGTMSVWDTGTYEPEKWGDREVIVVLHGERVDGRYVLFQTRGNQWMIHRMDPPADPDRQVWPGWTAFPPMTAATGSSLPVDGYGVEFAWGGQRVLTFVSGGRLQLHPVQLHPVDDPPAAEGGELVGRFRELRALGEALGVTEVVLDGEIIVLGEGGQPSRPRLSERLGARSDTTSRRLSERYPATLMVSDLLWLDGHPTMALPYEQRRRLLSGLSLSGPAWQVPTSYPGSDGPALLAAAGQQGLPGVVAKRLDSPYRPQDDASAWIFVPA
ncbi:MAG: bifunctional non-ous end joining protein LigD [Acidimicrobiaceae bacterium]|nr:bifunctional non-ous end joining protein LigD [Acidimicrobiaceae bacterium]